MQRQYDYTFKIILIGSTSVGKTALLKRFADNQFNETYLSTIGIDFRFKYLFSYQRSFYLDSQYVKLQVWDTAGQQRFKNITKSYYNGSHAVIIVYDVNDERSFIDIKESWVRDARIFCEPKQIYILGNKCDDQFKEYIKKQHLDWARQNQFEIIGVSAKTGNNVQDFFQQLTRKLMTIFPKKQHDYMKLGLKQTHSMSKKNCNC